MAKKSRRDKRQRRRSRSGLASESNTQPAAASGRRNASANFEEEYAYVLKDLRHILFLAIAMFLLLIVLNLALR